MRTITSAYKSRILLADCASEAMWQSLDHNIEPVDILNITNPDLVLEHHTAYLKAGADVIHTNSFGAFPLDLKKEGYGEEAFIINYLAAEAAARAVDAVPGQGRRRFVAGVVHARNLNATPSEIKAAASLQTEGLIAGGVDSLAVYLSHDKNNTLSLLKGIIAKRDELDPQVAVHIYRKFNDDNETLGAADLADEIIQIAEGKTTNDKWLAVSLSGKRPNLVSGGNNIKDTALIDAALRAWSQDGLRPSAKASRHPNDEGFMPASSSRRFEELKAMR